MEVVASLAIFALFGVNVWMQRGFQNREDAWATERRELLTRITHPEYIPVAKEDFPPDSAQLTAVPDPDYNLVGTIEGGGPIEGDPNANGDAS